jgi:hypothetical protein
MKEPTCRFPVVCRECGTEHLTEVPLSLLADALMKNEDILLRAPCHDTSWKASPTEIEQLRDYMGTVWTEAPRP